MCKELNKNVLWLTLNKIKITHYLAPLLDSPFLVWLSFISLLDSFIALNLSSGFPPVESSEYES